MAWPLSAADDRVRERLERLDGGVERVRHQLLGVLLELAPLEVAEVVAGGEDPPRAGQHEAAGVERPRPSRPACRGSRGRARRGAPRCGSAGGRRPGPARRGSACRTPAPSWRYSSTTRTSPSLTDWPSWHLISLHLAVVLGLDGHLHLHRLEDRDLVALLDVVADLARDLPYGAGDVGLDVGQVVLLVRVAGERHDTCAGTIASRRDPRPRPGHHRLHGDRLRRARAAPPGAPTASSASTSRGRGGSSTTPTRSGRSPAGWGGRRSTPRGSTAAGWRGSASPTSARPWWPGTATPASRCTGRWCGRTAARPPAATSCARPATSRWCASARASCSTPTSPARRSSG